MLKAVVAKLLPQTVVFLAVSLFMQVLCFVFLSDIYRTLAEALQIECHHRGNQREYQQSSIVDSRVVKAHAIERLIYIYKCSGIAIFR